MLNETEIDPLAGCLRISKTAKTGPTIGGPAGPSCPGMRASLKLGAEGVCAFCYAASGKMSGKADKAGGLRSKPTRYRTPPVQAIRDYNMALVKAALAISERCCTDLYKRSLRQVRGDVFRLNDSGDLHSVVQVRALATAIRELRAEGWNVRVWVPTRTWTVDRFLAPLRDLATVEGVSVRPSALGFDQAPPVVAGLHAGTSAERVKGASGADAQCPVGGAVKSCAAAGCDQCWRPELTVAYHEH